MAAMTERGNTAMDAAEARELTQRVVDGLIAADKAIEAIIRFQGWLALDYESFDAWWNAEIRGRARLTEMARARIVYALFDEGYTAERVATSGVGVGDVVAESLHAQWRDGVPASHASTRKPVPVKLGEGYMRNHATPQDELHLQFTVAEIDAWKRLGQEQGFDYRREAANAVRSRFAVLAAEGRSRGVA